MNTTFIATAPGLENLRAAIETIDALSRDGFGQIFGIAKLAHTALSGLRGQPYTEQACGALQAIANYAGGEA